MIDHVFTLPRARRVRQGCGALEDGVRLGDGYVNLLVLDGYDDIPVLVVAEYPGACPLETI
jgi:hypothetical protein